MTLSFPQGIVFDWDNTLVDNWPVIAASVNATFREFGKPVWTLAEVKERCHRAARDSFPDWFGDQSPKALEFFYRHFESIHLTMLEKLPGAEDLLEYLNTLAVPLFVVSNKRGDYLRQQAQTLDWTRFFSKIVGAQDTPHDKPARDPVDLALSGSGLAAGKSIWFAGDTDVDMTCAENAGCTPILINALPGAKNLNSAMKFSNCQELKTLLYKLHNEEPAL